VYGIAAAVLFISAVLFFTEYKGNVSYSLELGAKLSILGIDIYFTIVVCKLLALFGNGPYDSDKNKKKLCCCIFTEK
jgi:hypothetical protein